MAHFDIETGSMVEDGPTFDIQTGALSQQNNPQGQFNIQTGSIGNDPAGNAAAKARMMQLNNDPAYKQFTPEQVQQYLHGNLSRDQLNAYASSQSPFEKFGIYNDNTDGLGAQNLWFGPEAGPQHSDNGNPFGPEAMLTGGLSNWYSEQAQTAGNDMKNGAVIGALPFVGAGITAGLGAAGAAGAEAGVAGGAAVGGTETGITAGAAGSEFGATGAAGAGTVGGSTGSATLMGEAGADTLGGGETLFPGESATSGAASTGSGIPGDTSGLFAGEANPGAANTPNSGSLLDYLSRGPGSSQGFAGLQPSDLMKTGLNMGIQQLLAQRQQQQAQQVQQAGNPLNDPQRSPFQQQATNMVNNPGDYFANNPFASQLAAMYKNNIIPRQLAKSGNAGEVLDRTGSQFATALGGNYNQLLQTLSGFGGFNQPNSGVGASVPLLQGSNNAVNESFRGLGGLASKSLDGIFGDVTRPQQNGSGTNTTTFAP